VVLLSGEAGIGKSRIAVALLERLATEQHTRLRYFCSPQHTDSVLYPIISQMERAAGLAREDTRKRNSTSSMRCSHRARRQPRMWHCSQRCCRCRTMVAIPHLMS
jgi:predicted ATPase